MINRTRKHEILQKTQACKILNTTHSLTHLTVEITVRLWSSCLHGLFGEQLRHKHRPPLDQQHSGHMLTLLLFKDLHVAFWENRASFPQINGETVLLIV